LKFPRKKVLQIDDNNQTFTHLMDKRECDYRNGN
jgi:hypothetical protein